jgi:hypothetical protein
MNELEAYIASEKSDPFCRARVYMHTRKYLDRANTRGIAGFDEKGRDAFYSAQVGRERREYEVNGRVFEYFVPSYSNLTRP